MKKRDLQTRLVNLQQRWQVGRMYTEEVNDAKYETYYMQKELKEGTYLYEERPKKKQSPILMEKDLYTLAID